MVDLLLADNRRKKMYCCSENPILQSKLLKLEVLQLQCFVKNFCEFQKITHVSDLEVGETEKRDKNCQSSIESERKEARAITE